jgi:hypothetical protein
MFLKKSNCSARHFDERQRGEIQRNIEEDFSWRLAPLEMTGQRCKCLSSYQKNMALCLLAGYPPVQKNFCRGHFDRLRTGFTDFRGLSKKNPREFA